MFVAELAFNCASTGTFTLKICRKIIKWYLRVNFNTATNKITIKYIPEIPIL